MSNAKSMFLYLFESSKVLRFYMWIQMQNRYIYTMHITNDCFLMICKYYMKYEDNLGMQFQCITQNWNVYLLLRLFNYATPQTVYYETCTDLNLTEVIKL